MLRITRDETNNINILDENKFIALKVLESIYMLDKNSKTNRWEWIHIKERARHDFMNYASMQEACDSVTREISGVFPTRLYQFENIEEFIVRLNSGEV